MAMRALLFAAGMMLCLSVIALPVEFDELDTNGDGFYATPPPVPHHHTLAFAGQLTFDEFAELFVRERALSEN